MPRIKRAMLQKVSDELQVAFPNSKVEWRHIVIFTSDQTWIDLDKIFNVLKVAKSTREKHVPHISRCGVQTSPCSSIGSGTPSSLGWSITAEASPEGIKVREDALLDGV